MPPETPDSGSDVKALAPVVCPHCNQSMIIEFTLAANLLDNETAKEMLSKITPTNNEEA